MKKKTLENECCPFMDRCAESDYGSDENCRINYQDCNRYIEYVKQSISDKQVKQLAEWGMMIENHYGHPMDIEWALDGRTNELFITQARPETVQSVHNQNIITRYSLEKKSKVLCLGQSVGNKIGAGVVNRIMSIKEITKFKPGQVLVTDMTDPDWEPIMKSLSYCD